MGLKFTTPKSTKNTLTGNYDNQSDVKLAPQNKTFTENGTYNLTIPEGFDGIDESVIKVQVPSEVNNQTVNETITANGTYHYTPDASHSGLDAANITVSVSPKLQEKYSHSLNEVITPDAGKDGLSKVTVEVPVETKNVTYSANGSYTIEPSADKKAITKVIVNVDTEDAPELEEKTITENGVYEPSAGKDGFSKVTVDVAGSGELEELVANENNHTYTPSEGKDGFSKVRVEVPNEDNYYVVSQAVVADVNGTTISVPPVVPGYDAVYFDKLIVKCQVQANNEPPKLITTNGTYMPANGYDGFGKIVVDVDDSQYLAYPVAKQYTKVGDYTITVDQSEGTAISQVDVDVDIAKVIVTEIAENGVRGESYEVPMNKMLGGEFTTADGKKFKIEW